MAEATSDENGSFQLCPLVFSEEKSSGGADDDVSLRVTRANCHEEKESRCKNRTFKIYFFSSSPMAFIVLNVW